MTERADLEAGHEAARKVVATQDRRARRKGGASNVVLHPRSAKVPTMGAYAKALRLGENWRAIDLEGLQGGFIGSRPGAITVLVTPSGSDVFKVRPGLRAPDILRVGLGPFWRVALTDDNFDMDAIWAHMEDALDGPGGPGFVGNSLAADFIFWGLMKALTVQAVRDGWLTEDPLAPDLGSAGDDPWGTDDDPEPTAVTA